MQRDRLPSAAPWKNLPRIIAAMLMVWTLWAGWMGSARALEPERVLPASEAIKPRDFATGLAEPLVPTAATTTAEDNDLMQALASYRARESVDDLRPLETFLAGHPRSGWRVAVLANLGFLNLHYGYFSRAIEAWQTAWREGKNVTDPRARALVARAVGELARLRAGMGRADDLAALLLEIGDRPVSGSATEAVQAARETLEIMRTDPRHLFICGPMALKALMLEQGATPEQVRFLDTYRAGTKGVSLAELEQLAREARLHYEPVSRKPDEAVPVPSIVHWKSGHFGAILREAGGRYQIKDPVLSQDTLWVTRAAIDTEGSGYFLVPANEHRPAGWLTVADADARQVWGAGTTVGPQPGSAQPKCAMNGGMCVYSIEEMVVGLAITDTPVGYTPPKGPSAKVMLAYNQREDSQPANFSFFNVSQKWTLNWLSYVQDDPKSPGASVMRYIRGGGAYYYLGYNSTTHAFTPQTDDASVLTLVSSNPVTYQRSLRDGSVETYARSDGSTSTTRRVFLTQIADPAGNTVTLNYDASLRLTSITDATGRSTTFSYNLPGKPLLITAITDPFGRSAALTYDATGRLSSITDVIGLTSSFTYDATSLITSMTTPYGTTQFAAVSTANSRTLQITDPLGYSERQEFVQPAPVANYDPSNTVPKGITVENEYLYYRDSFHWDKHVYPLAGCKPTGGCNYNDARATHFNHYGNNQSYESPSVESVKNPLENRIWYVHPKQPTPYLSGTYNLPTAIGRVLDDGSTQLTQMTYNTAGNLTGILDPVGRRTLIQYAPNQIDVTAFQQQTSATANATIAQFTYNAQHLPLTYTDAAGKTTSYAYNSAGQLTQATDALGEVTTYQYDGLGYLVAVINANGKPAVTFAYDTLGRVATRTDSEGLAVKFTYDAMDRVTSETYPDGTTRTYTWNKLDLAAVKDRQGRITTFTYDAVRNLIAVTDPLKQVTQFGYYENQKLKSLTDPNGHVTSWDIDIEGRVTAKHYANATTVANTYEATTSRLKAVTDALGQVTQYTYGLDNRPTAIQYLKAVNATPSVAFTYDPYFPRVASMTDVSGKTQYAYQAIGAPGALQLAQETGPYANAAIAYQYDALGRVSSRTVGGDAESFAYDALGRPSAHADALGTFAFSYLGQTGQITGRASPTAGTLWSYDTNTNDRRLTGITNSGGARSYRLSTTPEYDITGITETIGATVQQGWSFSYDAADRLLGAASTTGEQHAYAYDAAGNITTVLRGATAAPVGYNSVNQIAAYNGAPFTYDANGNLIQDDLRTYSWDAANRLIAIAYKAQPGVSSTFRYDGLGRRIAIVTTNGAVSSEARYLWCGQTLCQARSGADAVTRRYLAEGEAVPAAGSLLYYATDQIGSVRDVLVATNSARAAGFDYEPYGLPTQAAGGTTTDFRYAGLFYHQQSGLYLATSRVYDGRTGRWLSRDPIGEEGGINLYGYADGNPASLTDPNGDCPICIAIVAGGLLGAGFDLASQLTANGGDIGCVNWAEVGSSGLVGGLSGLGGAVIAEGIVELRSAYLAEQAAEGTLPVGSTVIGKLKDLTDLQPGERTLLDRLPDLGSPKANWYQNSSVLRQELRLGNSIRDASVDPETGALINNTGFLRAERNLLANKGWIYNPETKLWSPP